MCGAASTFKYVFDYKPEDVFWCTADCGWITGEHRSSFQREHAAWWGLVSRRCALLCCRPLTLAPPGAPPPRSGHSYVTFGPLLMGATQILFEGVPTYPDAGRCWDVVDK